MIPETPETRMELLAVVLIERFGPDAAIADTRGQLIDDLPPDSRPGPTLVVQAVRR